MVKMRFLIEKKEEVTGSKNDENKNDGQGLTLDLKMLSTCSRKLTNFEWS